jgi:uncharacterized membrane protein YfcA
MLIGGGGGGGGGTITVPSWELLLLPLEQAASTPANVNANKDVQFTKCLMDFLWIACSVTVL